MKISEVILKVREDYVASKKASSYYEINNGLCDQFAEEVAALLACEDVYVVCGENFMEGIDGTPEHNDVWSWLTLEKHFNIQPPKGFDYQDIDDISFGAHVWILYDDKHYDAECEEGVESFFELPLFRRYLENKIDFKL